MAIVTQEEAALPRFPALSRCIVIDSSHRARINLVSSLKSCFLFEDIMEASSVADGGKKIANISYDACIIGSSISVDMANEFLKTYKPKVLSKDCAFIRIIRDGEGDPYAYPEAHGVVAIPSNRQKMFEGMARAILIASNGVGWPGVKLAEDGSIMLLEDGEWKVFGDCEPVHIREELPPGFVLSGDRESIIKFCESLPKTPRDKVEKIIMGLLSGNGSQASDPFVGFFISAIKEWQSDMTFMSLKEASQALKTRLLSFEEQSSQ